MSEDPGRHTQEVRNVFITRFVFVDIATHPEL